MCVLDDAAVAEPERPLVLSGARAKDGMSVAVQDARLQLHLPAAFLDDVFCLLPELGILQL